MHAIFIDLDETLIHTSYTGALLRPGALKLIRDLRELGALRMLTTATRDYAEQHNKTFDLGFSPAEIISMRDYIIRVPLAYGGSVWDVIEKGRNPAAVLIDNLPPDDEYPRIKMAYLGINSSRYIQIEDFYGEEAEEGELERVLMETKQILEK